MVSISLEKWSSLNWEHHFKFRSMFLSKSFKFECVFVDLLLQP